MSKVHIALLMMVKNEQKRLHVTLNSVIGHIDSLVVFDTGSNDNTVQILKDFSTKHNIPLHLKEGEFKNFSTSRNISLDFADTFEDIDYLILLDTNDELRNGKDLREFCNEYKDKPNTGFLLCQEWWSGKYDKYYNIRMVKARQGWRYRGRVHEWMKNTRFEDDEAAKKAGDNIVRVTDNIVIYQDRTQDDDKTGKRFVRDKILLLEDHKDKPEDPRTVFYLAQTCSCLQDISDSFYFYKLRTTLMGFWEERFHSLLRCGELSEQLNHPWEESFKWYMKAFEYSPRAEPLVKISEHYKDNNWLLSYTFADLACKLTYPEHCILFVDKHSYDYMRWHLLGISGWYSGFRKEGKIGCVKSIEAGLNYKLDTENLKYYENWEKEQALAVTSEMNKKQFTELKMKELEGQNLSKKHIHRKISLMWKNRNAKNVM